MGHSLEQALGFCYGGGEEQEQTSLSREPFTCVGRDTGHSWVYSLLDTLGVTISGPSPLRMPGSGFHVRAPLCVSVTSKSLASL